MSQPVTLKYSHSGAVSVPILVLSLILAAILAMGSGYWLFFRAEEPEALTAPKGLPPQYLILKDMVVNLRDEEDEPHYMQLEVAVMTRSTKCLEALEAYKPLIRNTLLDSFAEHYYQQMLKPDSRRMLRDKALTALKGLTPKIKPDKIDQILITNLVVQ